MRRLIFPATLIFGLICIFLSCPNIYGQKKPFYEVDLSKCWSYPLQDADGVQITSDGGRIFIGSGGGKIEALSLDGKKSWSSEFGGEISSNILAADGGLFFVTSTLSSKNNSADGKLRSVSKVTGVTNWTVKVPDAEEYFLTNYNGSVIVVSKNGLLQSFDVTQGEMNWKREIAGGLAADPEFTDKELVVAANGNTIFTVSMATGETVALRKTSFDVTALTVTENGGFIAGDDHGNIFSMNGTDRPLWAFKTGGRVSGLIAVGSHVLAASNDNFVYFLKKKNGARVWKKRMMGRVARIENFNDHFALLSSFEEHGAVLIDLSKGRVVGQIVLGDDESMVATPVVDPVALKILILTNAAASAFSLNGQAGCSK